MNWPLAINSVAIAFVLAMSHVLLRHAASMEQHVLQFPRLLYTLAAMLIYVAIFVYYSVLLQRFSLSRIYPIYSALSILFVYLSGTILFREEVTVRGAMGTLLIMVGGLVVASDRHA